MQTTSLEEATTDGKSDLGWKIGGTIAGVLSGLTMTVGTLITMTSPPISRGNALPYRLQAIGGLIGVALAAGLWQGSKKCRIGWIALVTLAAIAIAFLAGPVVERNFEGGTVVTYLFAFVGPVAWLILLERASTARIVAGATLVGAWHLTIIVAGRLLA